MTPAPDYKAHGTLRWILAMAVILVVNSGIAAVAAIGNVQKALPIDERVKRLEEDVKRQRRANEAQDELNQTLIVEIARLQRRLDK